MKEIGVIQDGIQVTTTGTGSDAENLTEIRQGGQAVGLVSSKALYSNHMISTPHVINEEAEIPADHQAVISGPLTIGADGSLTGSGRVLGL